MIRATNGTEEIVTGNVNEAGAFSGYFASMFSIEGCNEFSKLKQIAQILMPCIFKLRI